MTMADPISTTRDSTSSSLLERARGNDQDAWRRLSAVYTPYVYGWARQCGLQSTDAADVSQEVFRAVAQSISTFRKTRPEDSFRGWLWKVTRNKIRDHFRGAAARPGAVGGSAAYDLLQQVPENPPDDPGDGGTGGVTHPVARRALELMRSDFDVNTWQAFWLMVVDGRPAAEVAEELGMSKGAVRQAKYRVLRRLREELEGLL